MITFCHQNPENCIILANHKKTQENWLYVFFTSQGKYLPTPTILMFWCSPLGVRGGYYKINLGVDLMARCFLKFLPLIMLLKNCSLVFCGTSNDEEENCVSSISAAVALSLHCRWTPAQRLWGHKIRIPRGRAARKQGLNASWWHDLLIALVPSSSMEN